MTSFKKEKNTQTVEKTVYVFVKMSEGLIDGLNKAIKYSTDIEYANQITNEHQMFKSLEKKVEKLNQNFENLIKILLQNELITKKSFEENINSSKDKHPLLKKHYIGYKTKSYFEEYFDKYGISIEKMAEHANYEEGLNINNYLQHIVLKFDLPAEKNQEKNIQEQIKDLVFKEMPYANLTIALVEKFSLNKEFDFTINSLSSLKRDDKTKTVNESDLSTKYQTYFYLGRKIQNDKKQEFLVEAEKVDEKLKNIIKKLKKETDLTEDKIALITEIEQEVVKVILTDRKDKEVKKSRTKK